ncbi:MAG TPA: serine/threonine-protein kinase [Gemmatimonadales bacterium]|nr:serine/threonine-protein kinase [Gemmatimonadales bacterium]
MITPAYLEPGALLNERYEIAREIGRGGFSVVYRARDRALETDVAIKLLVPPPASARTARERLRREVQAVRGLAHANIVGVHDFLEEGAWSFVVMDLVDGPDLGVRVRDRGPLSPDDAARVGGEIAAALAAAHRAGILHRDVKPQNILLDRDGRARLADFGAARLEGQATMTRTGGLVGTLDYLAPEVMAGMRGDARADVYALGMTLHFALTGRLPDRTSPHLPPEAAAEGHHPRRERGEVPDWLDAAVAHATRADPARRFPSALSLADALAGRDAVPAVAARPAALDFCLLCGSSAAAGLTRCPDCGGLPAGRADVLVFAAPPAGVRGWLEARSALERLAASVPHPPDVGAAARGSRALVRTASGSADVVLQRFRERGIPVRAVRAGHAWSAVPARLYALVAAIAILGMYTGFMRLPYLWTSTPLVVGLLLVGAHRAVQRPLLAPKRARSVLPPALDRRLSETLGRLPPGPARTLLADLARLAHGVIGRPAGGGAPGPDADVAELLGRACDAASDLQGLDDTLALLERRREEAEGAPEAWGESITGVERSRDRLVQQLLQALTLLGRLQGHAADARAAGSEVAALASDLAARGELHAAALREVEAILADSQTAESQTARRPDGRTAGRSAG